MRTIHMLVVATVGAAAATTPDRAWANQPRFYGLSDFTAARGITNDGRVLLQGPFQGSGGQGFIWTPGGPLQPLDSFSPRHISTDGRVVISNFSNQTQRLTIPGSPTTLEGPPGTFITEPGGVSADGSAVAGSARGIFERRAWYWTLAGGSALVPTTGDSFGRDVSPDGRRVIGTTQGQAFEYTIGGALRLVPSPSGREAIEFRRFSGNASMIVGSQYSGGSNGQVGEAFTWSASGGFTFLGRLPPTAEPVQTHFADAVNFDGSVVAGSQGGRAWIWDRVNGMQDLQTLLAGRLGLDLGNYRLLGVSALSPDGSMIAGSATLVEPGATRTVAFVAVIPGPSAGAALLLGGLSAATRRDRRPPAQARNT